MEAQLARALANFDTGLLLTLDALLRDRRPAGQSRFAVGKCQCCQTATIRRPKHVAPPRRAATLVGALRLRAMTRTIEPMIAAVARKSTRRMAGTSASRTSRIV